MSDRNIVAVWLRLTKVRFGSAITKQLGPHTRACTLWISESQPRSQKQRQCNHSPKSHNQPFRYVHRTRENISRIQKTAAFAADESTPDIRVTCLSMGGKTPICQLKSPFSYRHFSHSPADLPAGSPENGGCIPSVRIRKVYWSTASSTRFDRGIPPPWPARVSIRINTGFGPA